MDLKESEVDQAPTVEKDVTLGEVHDIGANLYVEAEQLSAEDLEREGAEVLRILDWRIMPIVSSGRYILLPSSYVGLPLTTVSWCFSSMSPM